MLHFMNPSRLDHLAVLVNQTTFNTVYILKVTKISLCQYVVTFNYWDKISYQKFSQMLLSCWLFTLVVSSVFVNMMRKQLNKDFEV